MTHQTVDFTIRPALSSDEGFIAESYVATARMCTPRWQVNAMPRGAFSAFHYKHVGDLLRRCGARVACAKDDEDRLFGFSIVEGHHIQCVYVSKAYWRCGIGTALLSGVPMEEAIIRLWPNTTFGSTTEWMRQKLEQLTYLPYWLEVPHGGRAEV